MSAHYHPETVLTTALGTPYTLSKTGGAGEVTVTVGDHKAAKRVKRDASRRYPTENLRWRSLDGQTFDTLDAVADSMRWAL